MKLYQLQPDKETHNAVVDVGLITSQRKTRVINGFHTTLNRLYERSLESLYNLSRIIFDSESHTSVNTLLRVSLSSIVVTSKLTPELEAASSVLVLVFKIDLD